MKIVFSLVFMIGSIIATIAILTYNRKYGQLYSLKVPLLIIGGIVSLIVLLTYMPIIIFSSNQINIFTEIIAFVVWLVPSLSLFFAGIFLKRKSQSL
jgi:hypothetical protein